MGAIANAAFGAATMANARALTVRRSGWFAMPAYGVAPMASPPTVTSSPTSTMTTPQNYSWGSGGTSTVPATVMGSPFSYTRGSPIPAASSGGGLRGDNATTTVTPAVYGGSIDVNFVHTGASFEVVTQNTAGLMLVMVDGQYVSDTGISTAGSGSTTYIKYDFGTSATRRIRLSFGGGSASFYGVNINPTDTIAPAPIRGPRVAVLTDSYGGAASVGSANSFIANTTSLRGRLTPGIPKWLLA